MPNYPEHLRHVSYVGAGRYFLTFCTYQRQRLFCDAEHVALVCAQIVRTLDDEGFAGTAYCYMPDHVHLLVEATCRDANLKRFVRLAKQRSGFYFREAFGMRLWQRYAYERILRRDEATPAVAGYIVANPVRAGLVRSPLEYPFWGSFTHTREALLEYVTRAA